jgi:hypothetical protein
VAPGHPELHRPGRRPDRLPTVRDQQQAYQRDDYPPKYFHLPFLSYLPPCQRSRLPSGRRRQPSARCPAAPLPPPPAGYFLTARCFAVKRYSLRHGGAHYCRHMDRRRKLC